MAKPSPLDEIKKHQDAITALKNDAVSALKAEKSALENQIRGLDAKISELTGKPSEGPTRRKRSPSVAVSIEDIVQHIKSGVTNNNALAKATGASAAKIKAVVAKEGKKAGITSSGARSKFAYSLK
jgi:phage shock protein A